jgi:hypothetical protein
MACAAATPRTRRRLPTFAHIFHCLLCFGMVFEIGIAVAGANRCATATFATHKHLITNKPKDHHDYHNDCHGYARAYTLLQV